MEEKEQLTKTLSLQHLSQTSASQEIIDDLQKSLKVMLQQNELNSGNLLYITTQLMRMTGKYKTLSGKDKKQIVVTLVDDAIRSTDLDPAIQSILFIMVEQVVPDAIDLLVEVAKKDNIFKEMPKLFDQCGQCHVL